MMSLGNSLTDICLVKLSEAQGRLCEPEAVKIDPIRATCCVFTEKSFPEKADLLSFARIS